MQLLVTHADGRQEWLTPSPQGTLRAGAGEEVAIRAQGEGVHPVHCVFLYREAELWVAPVKGVGQVEVNGKPGRARALKPGDSVRVGDVTISVAGDETAASDELQVLDEDALADDLEVLDFADVFAPPGGFDLAGGGQFGSSAGFGSVPGMVMPGGVPQPGMTVGGGAPATVAPVKSRRKLGVVMGVIGSLLLLAPVVAGVVLLWLQAPAADESYAAAEQAFVAARYPQAQQEFSAFLAAHADDARAGRVRVRLGLASIVPAVERGDDWPATLALVRETLLDWGPLARHPEAQAGLAAPLGRLTAALVSRAEKAAQGGDRAAAETALKESQEAVGLLRRLLPPAAQEAQHADELELKLATAEQAYREATALAEALSAMQTAASTGKPGDAYAARDRLLLEFPRVAGRTALTDALTAAAKAESASVTVEAINRPALSGDSPTPVRLLALVAAPGTDPANQNAATQVVPVCSPDQGALYGLDASTGRVVWRRSLGWPAGTPQPLSGGAARLVALDAARGELVCLDAATGASIWRQPILDAVGDPLVWQQKVFVATRSGELLEFAAETGAAIRRFKFPQPLAAGPTASAAGDRLYVVSERASLGIIDPAQGRIIAMASVGHPPGGVTLPPVVAGPWLVVVERDGPGDSALTVVAADDGQTLTRLPVTDRVLRPPLVAGQRLLVATDRGQILTYEWTESDRLRPLRPGAALDLPSSGGAAPSVWLVPRQSQVLVASAAPLVIDAAAPDRLTAIGTSFGGSVLAPPTEMAGAWIACVRRSGQPGVVACALDAADGSKRWETRLGLSATAVAGQGPDDGGIVLATSDGRVFDVPVTVAADAGTLLLAGPAIAATAAGANETLVGLMAEDGAAAFSQDAGGDFLVCRTPGGPLRKVGLPGRLACPASLCGGHVLTAVAGGPLYLLDPRTGQAASNPAFAPFADGRSLTWSTAAADGDGRRIIAIAGRRCLSFAVEGDSPSQLTEQAQRDLDFSPTVAAVAEETVWLTDGEQLAGLKVADLSDVGPALAEGIAWGPRRIGAWVVAATDADELVCLGDAGVPVWRAPSPVGPVSGIAATPNGWLVLSSSAGRLAAVDAANGQAIGGVVDSGERLTGDPLVTSGRLFLMAGDGSLHALRKPLAEVFGNAAGETEVRTMHTQSDRMPRFDEARISLARRGTVAALAGVLVLLAVRVAKAQESPLLIDEPPYDQLTVTDEKEKTTVLKLQPLDLSPRRVPEAPDPETILQVRLFDRPDDPYEVAWKSIEKLELFEQLVLEQAAVLVREKDFDTAYACCRFVEQRDPDFPGLAAAYERCLFFEAAYWHKATQHDQALALLEELHRRNPAYKNLEGALTEVVDRLTAARLTAGDRVSARKLIESLAGKFPESKTVVRRSTELSQAAAAAVAQARDALGRNELRSAYDQATEAVAWWPSVAGGSELVAEVRQRYPVVFVAVEQNAVGRARLGASPWPELRRRRLVHRMLAEPETVEGATVRYSSPLGTWSAEGTQLKLMLNAAATWSSGGPVTTFDVARHAPALADPAQSSHSSAWSAALAGLALPAEREVLFTLRYPILRPEALWAAPILPWQVAEADPSPASTGPYEPVAGQADEVRYVLRAAYFVRAAGQPSELVERRFSPVSSALGPLAAGEVSAVDRIPPWELPRFRRQETLSVERYAQPTLHLLVPSALNRLLSDPLARRALWRALDRTQIAAELVGEAGPDVVQPLLGVLPTGMGDNTLAPVTYEPRWLLALVAASTVDEKRPTWVLAHPPTEVARRACRRIAVQLDLAGRGPIIELRELADPTLSTWDLLYVEWPVTDPRVDAERLFGAGGLAPGGAWVVGELAGLWKAASEQELASRLAALDRAVHAELPALPLWQVTEHFAFNKTLTGIGGKPFTLYQRVEDWRQTLEAKP